MDESTCRSGRTGSSPRTETFGYRSGLEEGNSLWGGKPSALGSEEGVRSDAQDSMVVEPQPVPSFVVIEPQFSFHLLVVALDSPPEHRQTNQVLQGGILGNR